jgi:hypothetical protein
MQGRFLLDSLANPVAPTVGALGQTTGNIVHYPFILCPQCIQHIVPIAESSLICAYLLSYKKQLTTEFAESAEENQGVKVKTWLTIMVN